MTAPEGSVTRPVSVPRDSCEKTRGARTNSRANQEKVRRIFRLLLFEKHILRGPGCQSRVREPLSEAPDVKGGAAGRLSGALNCPIKARKRLRLQRARRLVGSFRIFL